MTLSKDKELRLIELKDEQFEEYQLEQISKYVKWAQQYIREPHNSIIQPILVVNDFSSDDVPSLRDFNSGHKNCKKIKIFTWNTKGNKINFEEFNYND